MGGEINNLLDVADHMMPEEGQHWISPTFISAVVSGTPVIREPEKYTEIGWFTPDQVPPDLTRITRLNLAYLPERLRHSL